MSVKESLRKIAIACAASSFNAFEMVVKNTPETRQRYRTAMLWSFLIQGALWAACVYYLPVDWRPMASLVWVGLSAFTLVAAVISIHRVKKSFGINGAINPLARWEAVIGVVIGGAIMVFMPSAHAETLNEMLARQAAAGKQVGRTLENGPGWHQVYKTIYTTGKTADGKYNIYNIQGDLDDEKFRAGNALYSDRDVLKYLKPVDRKDIGKTVQCYTICKNAAGQVVGVNPNYK